MTVITVFSCIYPAYAYNPHLPIPCIESHFQYKTNCTARTVIYPALELRRCVILPPMHHSSDCSRGHARGREKEVGRSNAPGRVNKVI